MIDNNAQYSGLANIMNMRDRNPNTQLAYVPNGYLNSVPTAPNPYTGIPQVSSPILMNEGGMPSQQYPMQEEAGQLADRGRYGDTTLVHMTPGEVQGLASLGQLTINPDTGLPEAFNLRSIIPIAASVIGGMVAGPAGAAIGSGLGTLATGGSGEQALLSAAMSFGMGYAMQGGGSIFGDLGAAAGAGAGATGATGAGAAGAAGASGAAGAGAASEAALQSSLSTFGTGVGSNVGPALTTQGLPLAGLSTTSFTPVTDSLLPFNLNSTPSGVIGDVGSAAIPQSAIPSAARIGPTTTAAKFLGTTATAPSVTPPSSAEMAGYRSGLAEFSPIEASPELSWVERNIYNSAENVGGKGEGLLESYISPNRSSIQPTQADITKAYADRAAELQLPSVDNLSEQARSEVLENLKPGMLRKYGPTAAIGLGGLSLTGAFDQEQPEQLQIDKREVGDTGFGRYTLAGGEVKRPVATEEELRRRALEGGSQNYFTPYNYVRNAAEGGIVGLQQGGMATPQAPSAMSAMLNTPTAQQPIPINIAVQPPQQQQPMQQPMPMQGMGQPPQQGIQPLPDQSIEFKKNMDMEEQLQKQKTATSIQGQSALLGLIGGAGDYLQSQGMNYPTTTPSGTIPQTPTMNQGAQVNMGASGGFAQGGIINRADGGPTRQQFNDFMKNISNTPAGLLMRVAGLDKQFESQLPQGNAGSGAESMNQLLSKNVYSNNAGSSVAAPVQSEGGAASMNQLLSNSSYSKQLAMGGLLGYNEGGMPSQEQRYFEGQVVGNGDGQSDEVPFCVDGGEVDMAMLSPDEYVLAADVVSYIGDGSSNAGAAKLDQFMEDVREQAHGSDKQINGFDERGLANLVA